MGNGGCFFANAWAVYGRRGGTWPLLISGQDTARGQAWARADISVEVAGQTDTRLSPTGY